MMTIHEVSRLAGVSIRTLQYYDKIGLLRPSWHTDAGYRLYGDADLERLQQILLFRELEFPLKDIRAVMDSPGFDRVKAIDQQIELLTLKKEHIENLLQLARTMKQSGGNVMEFKAFDKSKLDEYARQAKAQYGSTPEYQEFEERAKDRAEDDSAFVTRFMQLFQEAGKMRTLDPASSEAQDLVKRLQNFITENMYTCSDEVLSGLGRMYSAGGEFTKNIDSWGGEGTGAFVDAAIQIYCAGKK